MQRDEATADEYTEDGARQPVRPRPWRLVPPAITPLEIRDLVAGVGGQLRGEGREQFRGDIESLLDARESATYTSFRRTLAGCFRELAEHADSDRRTVLIPAFCSSDFPDAIEGVGLDPVRYDVDPETLSLDVPSLRQNLDETTLAVVAVNVLGYSSPMTAIEELCREQDAFLVEALGYALGATYDGRPLGTFGDCAVLNFQQGKPIPVGGGMAVTRNASLSFSDNGRPTVGANLGSMAGYAALSRPRPYFAFSRVRTLLERAGVGTERATTHPESKFGVEYEPPFATISNFQGAIGHRVFGRLETYRRQRERTAGYYADALAECPGVSHLHPIEGLRKHQHVRFPLIAETESLRDRIREALLAAGIQARTLYDWPVLDPDEFPGASDLQRSILTLPTHPYVDERDRRTVVETVRNVIARGASD